MFIAHPKSRLEQGQNTERESSPLFTTINTFKELMDYLNHAPEAHRTEILLADFSARVAAFEDEGVWLGVLQDHYKMIEAILLLRPYGISFTTRKRFDGKLLIRARAKESKTPEQKDDDFVFSLSRLKVQHPPNLGGGRMTQKVDCPLCHGEGYLEESVPGGRFDARAEQWYPSEQQRECPLCRGCGSIDKPTHDNLFNLTSDYQQLKTRREFKRSTKNDVILGILGTKAA